MRKLLDCGRGQAFLLPPDLRDWVPEDDLAHFVIASVDRVPMSAFKVNERGTGSAQYHPRMMLGLVIYCYANGIFSSRRIERATHRDIGVRFVSANQHPDHDTIATFRRANFAAISESFLSDPDSRLMRRSRHHEYRQAYNAQATVDAEGSQPILGSGISQSPSDRNELVGNIASIPVELGRPEKGLADNGYANGDEVASLAEIDVEALVATGAEGRQRRYDFRPPKAGARQGNRGVGPGGARLQLQAPAQAQTRDGFMTVSLDRCFAQMLGSEPAKASKTAQSRSPNRNPRQIGPTKPNSHFFLARPIRRYLSGASPTDGQSIFGETRVTEKALALCL